MLAGVGGEGRPERGTGETFPGAAPAPLDIETPGKDGES